MTYAIKTNGLTKNFGDFTAVNNADIEVKEGTINGFIGPNGAGKSTTMKMLIGALNPSDGSGHIKDHPIGSIEAKKLLGFSPEHPKFYKDMKAQKYLVYMGMVCGMSRSEAENRAIELLKWLGIQDFANKKVGGFSAGMKQKVSLAQSLIHNPEILILDEPTANLDPAGRISIIENLKDLCKEMNVTVFISSHILAELEKLVDEVTLINHGKIVVTSNVESLEEKVSENRYVLKTSNNEKLLKVLKDKFYIEDISLDKNNVIHITAKDDDIDFFRHSVTRVILDCDVWLQEFNIEASGLESIFMKLVGEGEEDQKVEQEKNNRKKHSFLGRFKR